MFWRMGLSPASPVETILDKENFTLDELLDEDDIIQECKSVNGRLINFLRERAQVEQLIRYIVEEPPEEADRQRSLKFPFIACEIFTCEVDIILKALVEDELLMDLLFSFLDPERPHSTQSSGYFSKVVVCLLLRKTSPLMKYIQAHQDIFKKLVDLIRITSIMEVLIRLIGSDEHIYANGDSMQWLEDTNVLEMIVDKFSSSDCPEVHANAAETLCAIARYAPAGLASKISSPSFIGRLFRHALEDSRPKSVLVNLLSISISLLDPKRLTSGTYYMYNRQFAYGSGITAKPETVNAMLESLGDLLKLLDLSSEEHDLLTSYGKLQPPLGKHRLKIVEFISVLVTASSEVAEKEMIRLGAVKRILDLFFEYPYNNFLHHYVEQIVVSCLESKNDEFVKHVLHDCDLTGKILEAERNSTLAVDATRPTVPAEGRLPPRIGNIGHMTRIANKLIQLGNDNNDIQTIVQENAEWVEWQTNILVKRNMVENVFQWACGRPTSLQDRTRDSDDDDYQDRDYDVAALANNLSQAFQYGIYSHDDVEEAHGPLEKDDEDVYFDDESAAVVISSLRLGDDQESGSLFTNSNWFAFEDGRTVNEPPTDVVASPSPNVETDEMNGGAAADDALVNEENDLADNEPKDDPLPGSLSDIKETGAGGHEKPPILEEETRTSEPVELSPTLNSGETSDSTAQSPSNPDVQVTSAGRPDDLSLDASDTSLTGADGSADSLESADSTKIESITACSGEGKANVVETDTRAATSNLSGPEEHEEIHD